MKIFLCAILLSFSCCVLSSPAPQNEPEEDSKSDERDPPIPYHYKYTVKDQDKQLFIEKSESFDEEGKVMGKFSVLLADGRLYTVEYAANKDDGFIPKISFKDHADPFSVS